MESRNCEAETLRKLYYEGKSKRELMKIYKISSQDVMNRWFKESEIIERESTSTYTFNKHYFDEIDTEDKAYWLGFIWADGSVSKRNRKGNIHYEFRVILAEVDYPHLEKFLISLNANYPIRRFKSFPSDIAKERHDQCEVSISNIYFGKNLYENYGLIPRRSSAKKVIDKIPKCYYRDFIRGCIDADGSVNDGYRKINNKYECRMSLTTCREVCEFVADQLYLYGLTNMKTKIYDKRKGITLNNFAYISYNGNRQTPKILDFIYKDANTYLDRKYENYKRIIKRIENIKGGAKNEQMETKDSRDPIFTK